jgi:hypothetical protein
VIQIIGLLLCVYLVFKGVEILQIGISSQREGGWPIALGWLALVASIVIAAIFAFLLLASGAQATPQMPRLP